MYFLKKYIYIWVNCPAQLGFKPLKTNLTLFGPINLSFFFFPLVCVCVVVGGGVGGGG